MINKYKSGIKKLKRQSYCIESYTDCEYVYANNIRNNQRQLIINSRNVLNIFDASAYVCNGFKS